jgi:hypothetical protein
MEEFIDPHRQQVAQQLLQLVFLDGEEEEEDAGDDAADSCQDNLTRHA